MLDTSPLFTPFDLGPLKLSNRLVMAPMTRQRSPDMTPGPDVAAYYARRAAGGVGLIITEGTTIDDPASTPDPTIPGFHGDGLEGWREVRAAVHAAGSRIMPQLWHLGTVRRAATSPRPEEPSIGPSGLASTGKQIAEPMTLARIEGVIASFARAAADAQRLGFDGVELHGAHGYLIDQFFWEGTNRRADAWGGGDLASRARFGAEIVRAVRGAVGPDFPILLRWSQWKTGDYAIKLVREPGALAGFLEPLVDAGVTAFHCSTRRFWEPEFPDSGSNLNLAGWTKKVTGLPVITVGSVGLSRADAVTERKSEVESTTAHLDDLAAMVERGEVDLVAVGRALLANPEWPRLVREHRFAEVVSYTARALEDLV